MGGGWGEGNQPHSVRTGGVQPHNWEVLGVSWSTVGSCWGSSPISGGFWFTVGNLGGSSPVTGKSWGGSGLQWGTLGGSSPVTGGF